ncbi:MAG: hypothetical protein CO079_05180 [Nitrosopumilales archaeon CG_4_9_14_0_8_um_filter_34_10]|nr:MAG: hypothetical protein CO079_05180 [Nitrosopumilales archaeon CG_4_9_14_0_8_um_filter_34_10]
MEHSGYTTYPAELEKRTKRITRAGATLTCKHLAELGILQIKKRRSRTKSESSSHYHLREDRESFIMLTKNYFLTLAKSNPYSWQSYARCFMNSRYARNQINSTLVRDILSSKKVEMPMLVKVRNGIENQNARSENFQDSIPLSFPVMPSGATIKEMSSRVTIHDDKMTDDQKEIIPKIIEIHYQDIEEKILILPILALLQISPSALEYFLSDWKSYVRDENCMSFSSASQGFDMIEHVLFRLVWNTINDISLTRSIPEMGDVRAAYISGGNYNAGNPSPLLLLRCKDQLSIEYAAGFDSIHDYYGDGSNIVEIETNPENCSVKINCRKEIPPNVLVKVDSEHFI